MSVVGRVVAVMAIMESLLMVVAGRATSVSGGTTPAADPPPGATMIGQGGPTAGRLARVTTDNLINYYPADAGWSRMWTLWSPARIEADMARAAALHATSVRIIVFPQVFGYPVPDRVGVDRLAEFVGIAARHGLTARLTLFDGWGRFEDLRASMNWAEAIVGPYADDPRVVAVELKNEVNPDDPATMVWVRAMLPHLRQILPATPLTVTVNGGSGTDGLARLADQLANSPPDYYDFHFYGRSETASATMERAIEVVAPVPLVIGEVGLSTTSHSETEQAVYLARVFAAAQWAGIRSVAPWILNDFRSDAIPFLPPSVDEYGFGLFRSDGTAKPSADVVRRAWAGHPADPALLNPGFERGDLAPWRAYLPELGRGILVTSMAHSGRQSVMFADTDASTLGVPAVVVSPIAPVRPGGYWQVTTWARGERATGHTAVALSWFDATGRWLGDSTSLPLPSGNTPWTPLVAAGTAPPTAAALEIHLKSGDNAGAVWFDDIEITSVAGHSYPILIMRRQGSLSGARTVSLCDE